VIALFIWQAIRLVLESPDETGTAVQVKADALLNVCKRKVAKTNPKGAKTECLFADGPSILLSNFLASSTRMGDELLFPLDLGALGTNTEIYSHVFSFGCSRQSNQFGNYVSSVVLRGFLNLMHVEIYEPRQHPHIER
jgi:hypothetical protein